MQIHAEIPEDHEVAYLQKDKLEQEFRRFIKCLYRVCNSKVLFIFIFFVE